MAQRKTKHRRRRGRGSLGPLLRLVSVVLTAVAVVVALTLFFKVDEIVVSGNGRYSEDEIISVSGVEIEDNLILLDKYYIARELYTRLPYITDVQIRRELPDRLAIEVTETKPAFAVESGGVWWLVSGGGKILETVEENVAGEYLLLRGVTALGVAVGSQLELAADGNLSTQRMVELVAALSERNMLSKTDSVDAGDSEILHIYYDGRFDVELYYDADLAFKFNCLRAAVNELQPNEMGTMRMTMADENEVRFIPLRS